MDCHVDHTHAFLSTHKHTSTPHPTPTHAHTEADATAALALLETAVCRLVYLPTAGVDPPSTTALGGQRPPPQLTPTSLNTHDAVVQLLPGLFVGGFAHAARTGAGEGGGGPLLDDDEGQRPRQEQEQQQHPCTAASERATARALRAVGRLVGRRQGEQQQRQQQQLIMLETFSAPLTAEGDIAGAGGGGDSGGDGGGSRGPFSLSPAFLAGAGIDPGEGEEGRCRLLLHVRGGWLKLETWGWAERTTDFFWLVTLYSIHPTRSEQVGFTHRRRKQRLTTAATPRPGEPAASATASPTATTKAQEEEEGEGPSPCAARYEDPSSNDGAAGPTLLAPGCFGAKGGSYALVRLGRGARGGRTGQGLWAVRDVAFERVR